MRVWQGFVLSMLLVPLALGLACPVQATEVHGRASTVVEWYDSADGDTAIPVHQYLQFSLIDIADKGYNFKAYGRLADDIENEIDVDSRLYYAYLEKRDLYDGFDFRLGRQFISTTAGASFGVVVAMAAREEILRVAPPVTAKTHRVMTTSVQVNVLSVTRVSPGVNRRFPNTCLLST